MKKQKLVAISNKESYIRFTFMKTKNFYKFLLDLLVFLGEDDVPDLFGDSNSLPDESEEIDSTFTFENDFLELLLIVGSEKIFLMVKTDLRNKLNEFIQINSEFIA